MPRLHVDFHFYANNDLNYEESILCRQKYKFTILHFIKIMTVTEGIKEWYTRFLGFFKALYPLISSLILYRLYYLFSLYRSYIISSDYISFLYYLFSNQNAYAYTFWLRTYIRDICRLNFFSFFFKLFTTVLNTVYEFDLSV